MRVNLPFWVRFLIVAAIITFFILALVQWTWFNGILSGAWFLIIPIILVFAWASAGITKGMLPTKKTVDQSKDAWNQNKHKKAIIDTGIWFGLWVVAYSLAVIGHASQL